MISSLRWRENKVLWTFIQRTWDSVRLLLKYNQRMLVVEELACGNINILDSSGTGLLTIGCQIKRRCIQFLINITYCPYRAMYILDKARQLLLLLILGPFKPCMSDSKTFDFYISFLISKLGSVFQLLGMYLWISGHLFLSGKERTA